MLPVADPILVSMRHTCGGGGGGDSTGSAIVQDPWSWGLTALLRAPQTSDYSAEARTGDLLITATEAEPTESLLQHY